VLKGDFARFCQPNQLGGKVELVDELRRQLERELARGDHLAAELAEARLPLLSRLLALLRRQG
jgi:hypothetical protein